MKLITCEKCGAKHPEDPSGMCPVCTPPDELHKARMAAADAYQVKRFGHVLSDEEFFTRAVEILGDK